MDPLDEKLASGLQKLSDKAQLLEAELVVTLISTRDESYKLKKLFDSVITITRMIRALGEYYS